MDILQQTAQSVPVITIDGPSASGKGTVSRRIAQSQGWHLLDSGALYRLVAYAALKHQVALTDVEALARIARELDVEFVAAADSDEAQVMLEGDDVSLSIRSEKAGDAASQVAVVTEVREALLERQRAFQKAPGLVADGRDMGTVIFPSAKHKFFITASAEERAKRRYKQLKEKGISASLANLFDEIAARDKRDSERAIAPLKPADDAVLIDTSKLSIEEVVEKIKACL
jgi:cytidylate kinase